MNLIKQPEPPAVNKAHEHEKERLDERIHFLERVIEVQCGLIARLISELHIPKEIPF